jgi:hypothetical protein
MVITTCVNVGSYPLSEVSRWTDGAKANWLDSVSEKLKQVAGISLTVTDKSEVAIASLLSGSAVVLLSNKYEIDSPGIQVSTMLDLNQKVISALTWLLDKKLIELESDNSEYVTLDVTFSPATGGLVAMLARETVAAWLRNNTAVNPINLVVTDMLSVLDGPIAPGTVVILLSEKVETVPPGTIVTTLKELPKNINMVLDKNQTRR